MASKTSPKIPAKKKMAAKKSTGTKKKSAKISTKKKGSASKASKSSANNFAEPISVKQSSEYRGHNLWDWSVWIEAPDKVLNKIEYVEYKLHKTFPDPVQRRTDPAKNFRLDSSGWGEFKIDIELKQSGGSLTKTHHWLTLEYPTQPSRSRWTSVSAKKKKGSLPTIFLCAGLSDLRMANALSESLKAHGFVVLRTEDSPDLPWDVAITMMMKKSDLMLLLVSGDLTSVAKHAIDAAVSNNVHILPIMIAPMTIVPDQLEHLQWINLKESSDPSKIAPHVADQIIDMIKKLTAEKHH